MAGRWTDYCRRRWDHSQRYAIIACICRLARLQRSIAGDLEWPARHRLEARLNVNFEASWLNEHQRERDEAVQSGRNQNRCVIAITAYRSEQMWYRLRLGAARRAAMRSALPLYTSLIRTEGLSIPASAHGVFTCTMVPSQIT